MFFIYGYAGTDKTYLYKTITNAIRSESGIVLNVASSVIAALLLYGGRNTHSRFALPINVFDDSMCSFSYDIDLADLIRQTKLIISDEAPIVHRHCFEVLERTMADICRNDDDTQSDNIFGGKVVLFGIDLRHILSVIPGGSRHDVVNASINSSHLWKHCTVMRLTVNMKLGLWLNYVEKTEIKEFANQITPTNTKMPFKIKRRQHGFRMFCYDNQ